MIIKLILIKMVNHRLVLRGMKIQSTLNHDTGREFRIGNNLGTLALTNDIQNLGAGLCRIGNTEVQRQPVLVNERERTVKIHKIFVLAAGTHNGRNVIIVFADIDFSLQIRIVFILYRIWSVDNDQLLPEVENQFKD